MEKLISMWFSLCMVTFVFQFVEIFNNALNNKLHSIDIFIVLKKALLTVIHKILLAELECLGMRGLLLTLLRNYLRDCLCSVC